jgi:uncharacterized protein (DUF305 family)
MDRNWRDVLVTMARAVYVRALLLLLAALGAASAPARCQQANAAQAAPIVQPGAPGHAGKTLTPAAATVPRATPSAADIAFMQGMVMHHQQAVEMTEMLRTRSHDPQVQELAERIRISQGDEMRYMKQWLTDRGLPLTATGHMAGMDMSHGSMDMGSMPMMPGMLTPPQMQALRQAKGPAFDHLFLTGMIQHHTGALTMVKQLFVTPGAGQDPRLFDFASDVDNTQQAEINIMKNLLKERQ